jgi:hypothetical protein
LIYKLNHFVKNIIYHKNIEIMTIENPNLLERIRKIEERLNDLEYRLLSLERLLNRRPLRPSPQPKPYPSPERPGPPGPPGPPPEPFRFKED